MAWVLAVVAGCSGDSPSDRDSAGPPEVDERLVLGDVQACADPSDRDESGPYDRVVLGEDWPRNGSLVEGGRGVSIDDLDGDGHLDLFVPHVASASRFLFGDGLGGFVDRSELVHPDGIRDAFGASTADFDADGDVDLFVYRARSPAVILRNRGDGTFEGEPHPEWETLRAGCGGSGSWGDLDLDGDLDLFYGRLGKYTPPIYQSCPSALLGNDGSGGFVDWSDRIPADVQHLRIMASGWYQLDGDPWPELYVVADLPSVLDGNRLLDNDGAALTTLTGTGLEVDIAGMGLAAGDLNDDGVVDFAVPGIDEIPVLLSLPSAGLVWVDHSATLGIAPDRSRRQSVGWGGELVDLDNDGLLDLPMAFGTIPYAPVANQPDEIWRNTGGDWFEPVGSAWGFADAFATRGFAVADLDEDGWVDIAKREIGGVVVLSLSRCGEAHWLDVALDNPEQANRAAVGATVEVDAGGRTFRRTVTAGSSSYDSSGPPRVWFGLGAAPAVDALRVTWPSGERTVHPGFAADRALTVTYAVSTDPQ